MSYAESDDEDTFAPVISTRKRKGKKPVIESDDDDEDTFMGGLDGVADDDDGKSD